MRIHIACHPGEQCPQNCIRTEKPGTRGCPDVRECRVSVPELFGELNGNELFTTPLIVEAFPFRRPVFCYEAFQFAVGCEFVIRLVGRRLIESDAYAGPARRGFTFGAFL
ncbi:hypothetical protein ACFV6U_05215 [Streptomyces sp. NPDC059810]|uniref:hypothetical protein n=1 Tax=Streptomyces sp. NPDC059810 TaxID=3346956 RepID=UPI003667CCE1